MESNTLCTVEPPSKGHFGTNINYGHLSEADQSDIDALESEDSDAGAVEIQGYLPEALQSMHELYSRGCPYSEVQFTMFQVRN